MSSNIAVTINADVSGLTAKLAVAKADLSATTAELRNMAAQMRAAGASASDELKAGLAKTASAAASAQGSVARLRSELQAARGPMDGVSAAGEHQAGVFREKLILAHETLMGNYKRMAGSMMVLSERTGSLGGAIGALVTPMTLVVAAVVAVAGAFVGALASAERWNESFGEIKAAMDATGQGMNVSRAQLSSYIDSIRQLHGANTETATEMVEMFARQRDIGVGSYAALGLAAAGYARVTGSDVPKAAGELVAALNGGYDSLAKLDQRFSFLSTEQAQAIHDFDASGQKAQAYAVAIGALQAKFGPLINDGLTPFQHSTNDLKNAWQNLTRAIGDSSWANAFVAGVSHVLEGVAWLVNGFHSAKQAVTSFSASASIPAAGVPAAGGSGGGEQLRILREIQDENFRLKADDAERDRIKKELARDEEALKTATGGEAALIRDNIALLQRQQREVNNRVGAGQMQDLRDQLEQELVQRRLIGDQEKQYELRYWQEHLEQVQAGSKAELEIRKQIATLQHDLGTKALSDEWQNFSEAMRLRIEASKSNVAQQIALAEQWVEKGKDLYGNDIKNYKTALDEKTRLLQQQIQDDRKIHEIALASRAEIARIDLAGTPAPKGKGSILDSLFGDVDGSGAKADLDRRMDALKAEFVAKQTEFNDVINDSNSAPVQIAEAEAKLAAATEQYAVDAANLNKQAAQQVTEAWENAFAPIEHAFDSSIEGMLRGTQTLQDGMRKLAQSMVLSFIQSGIKQAFAGLAAQLSRLTAPVLGEPALAKAGGGALLGFGGGTAGIGGQAAQSAALTANTTALTSLTAALTGHGAVVTANTTATTAGTAATTSNTASQTSNLIGNTVQTDVNTSAITANTAALSSESASSGGGIFGDVLSFLPAFDVGTDNVPRDMVAQIHQGEIIVPAAQATNLRSGQSMLGYSRSSVMTLPTGAAENMRFANANEPPSGVGNTYNSRSSGDTNFHYSPTINAGSNVDLEAMLTQQGATMRRWLNNQMRNGSFRT